METLIHYGALALQTDWKTFRVMYDDAVMVESDDYREAVVLFFGTLEMQIRARGRPRTGGTKKAGDSRMIHKAVGATALVAGILLVLCALGGMDCGTVGFARGMLQAWGGLILSAAGGAIIHRGEAPGR